MNSKTETKRNERVINFINNCGISKAQLAEDLEIYQPDISKILNNKREVGLSICYKIAYKYGVNPRWIELGEEPMYINNEVQNNANSGAGTQINNINGDNNVSMTLPKEAWEMLQSQQRTIESQQQSVNMAQTNMLELIKTFNK